MVLPERPQYPAYHVAQPPVCAVGAAATGYARAYGLETVATLAT
ncbi:hypothetical protein [Streptomyces sp. NPDC086989]